jgi:hypothetical protein
MRRNVAMFVSALPVIGLTLSGCGGAVNNDGRSDASAFTGADTKSSLDQAAAICEPLGMEARAELNAYLTTLKRTPTLSCQVDSDCSLVSSPSLDCVVPCGQMLWTTDVPAFTATTANLCDAYFRSGCAKQTPLCLGGYAICEQGGCSISDRPAPTDGGRSDQGQLDGSVEAAAPDRPEQGDAPAACTGPLKDRWGICPATFDGHPETFGCRFRASGVVRAAVIDGRQVIEWSNFPTTAQCVYASVNNGAALVGEINIADSLLFCDRTSYSQAFGSVPGCLPWSCDLADLCTPSSCTCPPDAGA